MNKCIKDGHYSYQWEIGKMTTLRTSNTSGHRNINWSKQKKKWCVEFKINYKKTVVGYFEDIEDAITARDKHILENNIYITEYSGLSTKEQRKVWQEKNMEKVNKSNKKCRLNLKKAVIEQYGGVCKCCGEDELDFLTIDHMNNNGAEHRRSINVKAGYNFYHWLKTNDFPKDLDLRVLCFNCNCARQYSQDKKCPHETLREQNELRFEEEVNVE